MASLASSILLEARPAYALSLGSSQPVIKQTMAPGETIQGSIEVSNYQEAPLKLRAYLQDWRYKTNGDGEKDFSPPQTMPRSASGWVSFYPSDIDLPAMGKAVIDYTIRVPEDAVLSGEYTTVLFFEAESGGPAADGFSEGPSAHVVFAARLGSLFYIDVKDTVRREGRLSAVTVARTTSATPARLRATLANEGNAVLLCEGAFHVLNADNVITSRGPLPNRWVWPGDTVPVETDIGDVSSGTAVMTYDCGGDLVLVEETQISADSSS